MKGSIDICTSLAGHAKKTFSIMREKENNNMSFYKTHFIHFLLFLLFLRRETCLNYEEF